MADDLLDGVLGGEEKEPESAAPEAAAGAEAFAAAVAARLSAGDPGVARKTEIFLDEQAQLLATQRQHLHDEHALRLEHLAHQRHLLRGQRLGQALRITFQLAIALFVILVGIGIALMLHDALTSHSVVIDAFDAPAALAARGVTGTVVASDVLDELTRLEDATRIDRDALGEKRSLSNGWSSEVKVDVPETGISLGELSRLLEARLGRDLHIGGDLVETDQGGLALTVRGTGISPRTFTGDTGDLDRLVVGAAQYVYARFQPFLWVTYLEQANRCPEAIAFVKSAYASADDHNRAAFLTIWGFCELVTGTAPDSIRSNDELDREAIELDPEDWNAYENLAYGLATLGDEEDAWHVGKALHRAADARRVQPPAEYLLPWEDATGNLQAERDALDTNAVMNRGIGTTLSGSSLIIARIDVQLHDPTAAALILRTLDAAAQNSLTSAGIHFVRALLAKETGETAQAAMEMEAYETVPTNLRFATAQLTDSECWVAPIEEAAGHPGRADAILANPAAAQFVSCRRFRGDILDHRGDWAGAQQAYAAAVALAPDLPAGYYSWGVALARHGDLAGALAKLQAANQRGPHWADPLKAWGDVLVTQGRWKDALAKYDEALKYAPNWEALKVARDAAAARRS